MNFFNYVIYEHYEKKDQVWSLEAHQLISLVILIYHQVLQLFKICWLSNFESN